MNVVIGKNSNLSQMLQENIKNVTLISTQNALQELDILELENQKNINIIFNNFQTATKLNTLESPIEYINRSIVATAEVLNYIQNLDINKIIYTSSSSVYGNNIFCSEEDTLNPLNLHSSLKIANEKMIEKFCSEHGIDYTIARIFNMYGRNDNFSVIAKIEKAYQNETLLSIVNNGNAIRDFIHIEDVVNIYKKLLELKDVHLINIGTGKGVSIKNILDFLNNKNIAIKYQSIYKEELKTSTANNSKLLNIIGDYNFKNVENFLINKLSGQA